MVLIGHILNSIGSLGILVCFIILIIKMFQQGATGIAIALLLLLLCCGVGFLIGFIYGWIRSREWNIQNLMIAWTVCLILSIVGNVLAPFDYSQFQQFQAP